MNTIHLISPASYLCIDQDSNLSEEHLFITTFGHETEKVS
jgi:hypothetical protein